MKKVKPDVDQVEKLGVKEDLQRVLNNEKTPVASNISAETMSTENLPDIVPQPAAVFFV